MIQYNGEGLCFYGSGAYVYEKGMAAASEVKNLGWLDRNRNVKKFVVVEHDPSTFQEFDCYLVAFLHDGRRYSCDFADRKVLRSWLSRRVWSGETPVDWFGVSSTVATLRIWDKAYHLSRRMGETVVDSKLIVG